VDGQGWAVRPHRRPPSYRTAQAQHAHSIGASIRVPRAQFFSTGHTTYAGTRTTLSAFQNRRPRPIPSRNKKVLAHCPQVGWRAKHGMRARKKRGVEVLRELGWEKKVRPRMGTPFAQ